MFFLTSSKKKNEKKRSFDDFKASVNVISSPEQLKMINGGTVVGGSHDYKKWDEYIRA